jgi:predicted Zn-dependent protease
MTLALAALAVFARRRIEAFELSLHPMGTQQLQRATELDPGHIALRLRTAYDWIEQRRCDLSRPHLEMLARAAPNNPMLASLAARCSEH